MRDIATATLSGNLTRDVELKQLPSGAEVARLRVASTARRRNGEEWVDKTNYFTIEVFHFTSSQIGRTLGLFGIVFALFQAFGVGPLVRRFTRICAASTPNWKLSRTVYHMICARRCVRFEDIRRWRWKIIASGMYAAGK